MRQARRRQCHSVDGLKKNLDIQTKHQDVELMTVMCLCATGLLLKGPFVFLDRTLTAF